MMQYASPDGKGISLRDMTVWQCKLAVFDVDGTLTEIPSVWEYLHKNLGIWESQGLPNLNGFLAGEFDYEEFANRDAQGYKGLERNELERLLSRIPLRPGFETCMQYFIRRKIPIVYLSTGLDILVDSIPYADYRMANQLIFNGGICSGSVRVKIPIYEKKKAFESVLDHYQISACDCMAAGDSEGDIEILRMAGFSIAIACRDPQVRMAATTALDSGNLADIPQLVEAIRS